MVRTLSLIFAVAGALLFPIPAAFAKDDDHDHHHHHDHGDDHDYDHDHGHHKHWYHGRYWDYGVGRCWQWTPVGYIWICED